MRSFSDMWYDPVARKKILIFGGGGLAFIIILIIIIVVATSGSKSKDFNGSWILSEVPLVDGHNDVANNLYLLEGNVLTDFDFNDTKSNPKWQNEANEYPSHTDLTRLDIGKVRGQFWSAYVDCSVLDPVTRTLEQIDVIKRLVGGYPARMQLVTEHDGIMETFYQNKIGSLIGVEGGHSIDSNLAILRLYYQLGVRYMTLTHTCSTPWAATCDENNTVNLNVTGLTDFGKAVVTEMNRIGMMVDLAHVSEKTMNDVLDFTKVPVIFSHSSSANLTNIARNVNDATLKKLATNKGIIMVNFGSNFVRTKPVEEPVTMDDVIAHLDHIKTVTGSSEYVGIGGDYDGLKLLPEGLEDVSKYPDLFDKLAIGNRSVTWDKQDLRNLASANLIRVMTAVEKYRDEHKDDPAGDSVFH